MWVRLLFVQVDPSRKPDFIQRILQILEENDVTEDHSCAALAQFAAPFSFTCLQVNHLADIDEIPVPVEDGQGKKVRCAVVSTTVLPNFLSS